MSKNRNKQKAPKIDRSQFKRPGARPIEALVKNEEGEIVWGECSRRSSRTISVGLRPGRDEQLIRVHKDVSDKEAKWVVSLQCPITREECKAAEMVMCLFDVDNGKNRDFSLVSPECLEDPILTELNVKKVELKKKEHKSHHIKDPDRLPWYEGAVYYRPVEVE